MVFKAAVVFIAGGLMGSGIVALTRSDDGPAASAGFHHETNRHGYVQASFAAQRPFAALGPVTRQ